MNTTIKSCCCSTRSIGTFIIGTFITFVFISVAAVRCDQNPDAFYQKLNVQLQQHQQLKTLQHHEQPQHQLQHQKEPQHQQQLKEKCYFRSGRRILTGQCLANAGCCDGGRGHSAVGLCSSEAVCCFGPNTCNEVKDQQPALPWRMSGDSGRSKRAPVPKSTGDGFSITSIKATVHINEMTEPMKEVAIRLAAEGFERYADYNDVAEHICTRMDAEYHHENWSCVVGSNFGYSVPYKAGKFIEFYLGSVRVLLFIADR